METSNAVNVPGVSPTARRFAKLQLRCSSSSVRVSPETARVRTERHICPKQMGFSPSNKGCFHTVKSGWEKSTSTLFHSFGRMSLIQRWMKRPTPAPAPSFAAATNAAQLKAEMGSLCIKSTIFVPTSYSTKAIGGATAWRKPETTSL